MGSALALVVASVIAVIAPVAVAHGTGAAAQATAFAGRAFAREGFAVGVLFCVVERALCVLCALCSGA